MLVSQLLSLPADVVVEDLLLENQVLTLVLASSQPSRCCPVCSQPSTRVHSRYTRTLADLPCQGRLVRLQIEVRRFRCIEPTCARTTFAEPFPGLAAAYARRTSRQAQALREVALALGGRAGAPLAKKLSLPTSRHTLLRLLRRTPAPSANTPRQIGIDDFAWKKGDHYGTILVDLARHCPVDLLADRSAESVTAWLLAHPGVELISRDRAGAYADCKWKEKVAAFGRDTCRFLPHIARKVALSITQPEEILAVILKRKEIPAALSEGTTPCFSENSTGLRSGERADQEMRSFTEKTRERAAEARFQAQRNREVKVAARNRKT